MKKLILDQNRTAADKVTEKDVVKGAWDKLKPEEKDKMLRILAEKMGVYKEK